MNDQQACDRYIEQCDRAIEGLRRAWLRLAPGAEQATIQRAALQLDAAREALFAYTREWQNGDVWDAALVQLVNEGS